MINARSPKSFLQNASIQLFLTSAIDTDMAKIAQETIRNLFILARRNHLPWLTPRITANDKKGILFEWWKNNRVFMLSVKPDKSLSFIKAHGSNDSNKKWDFSALKRIEIGQYPSKKELLTIWRWLTAAI